MSQGPRRFNDRYQDRLPMPYDVASTAATATKKLFPCFKSFVLEQVDYDNITGLAADPTNYFDIELKNLTQGLSMAKWSTLTGTVGQGALAADTFVKLANNPANLITAAGDVLAVVLTLHGAQTLPAGRIVVHGRYL